MMHLPRAATLLAATAVAIVAPLVGANIAAASPGTASIAINSNGTATITYSDVGLTRGLFLCDPSMVATDLTQCNVNTYSYVLSSDGPNLPASPFVVSTGMSVLNFAGDPVALPTGRYTLVFLYGSTGPVYTWLAGVQDVFVGPVASTPIPDWLQAVGRESSIATCPFGWNPSWHEWPNGHTGGFVCARVIPSLG